MIPENHKDFSGGYVAIPDEIMRTPMSDGAFRLLCILCSYADKNTGECFPRMSRLADDQGKSKAAISGYLGELRALGLVRTRERYKRRGNCILNYLITFWSVWREQLRSHTRVDKVVSNKADHSSVLPVRDGECPVQPAEHHINQTQDNQKTTTGEAVIEPEQRLPDPVVSGVIEKTLEKWKELARGAPYPSFCSNPSADLVEETRKIVQELKSESVGVDTSSSIDQVSSADLKKLWKSVNVQITNHEADEHARLINAKSRQPRQSLRCLATLIRETWKRYWKKPSTAQQLSQMLNYTRVHNAPDPAVIVKYLTGVLDRYDRSQAHLYTRV